MSIEINYAQAKKEQRVEWFWSIFLGLSFTIKYLDYAFNQSTTYYCIFSMFKKSIFDA